MKMTTTLKTVVGSAALCMLLFMSACEGPSLETRTFRVDHLEPHEVTALLDPYVYGDRADAPGSLSAIDGAITVRETSDNLARIERVLAEFDEPRPDVRLFFQLIEADGFTDSDPRIADVEVELRKLFQFRGYRLAGEATVLATDYAEIAQGMRASGGGLFELSGRVFRQDSETIRLADMMFTSDDGWSLRTSVNIRNGQTIVLGSSPKGDSSATLFLTVRAEEGGPLADNGAN